MLPIATVSYDDPFSPLAPFLPIRALLLDDNRFDQRRIERMARDTGLMISVDIAPNLAAMSEYLDLRGYDVAFLDYRLPVGSGRDAVELLREHGANSNCAAIMVAGDEYLDNSALAMREACDGFISKDQLSTDILRASVTAILNDRAFEKSSAKQAPSAEIPDWHLEVEEDIECLIREIRRIRTMGHQETFDLAGSLAKLERRSIRIWSDIRKKGAECIGQEAKFDVLAGRDTHRSRAN